MNLNIWVSFHDRGIRSPVGVCIQYFHVEGTTGQFEIALAPLPQIQAVDQLVQVHDMVKAAVSKHGYIATMVPNLPQLHQPSGEHIHISLSPTDHEDSFLAGMPHYLPGIRFITIPFAKSYERIGKLEAGERADWVTENHDVAVRKIEPGHGEIRTPAIAPDVSLALGATVADSVDYGDALQLLKAHRRT
ncbi:hypothetical protein BDW59DRAFT_161543 [Aspergillus cavernicola]|uniref:GS catalytic domain-containing protein n=1 Tax=Aspergillus cavernicola TaxID=176166 RepID=A0ABR4IF95_9EURO